MRLKPLGKSGIQVSSLVMGTMTFGREADEQESARMFKRCLDAGIQTFDCADLYAQGESERILGRLVRGIRDQVVITSKVYFEVGPGLRRAGLSRKHILSAAEASLRRLGTDYIDLYFLHHYDDQVPLEETLGATDELVRQGKVRFIGASNFAAWQVMRGLWLSDRLGYAAFACIQPMYNLVKRQAEVELFPMAQAHGLGVLTYSPLGGGLLTGKYFSAATEGRLATDAIYRRRYGEPWMAEVARRFVQLAQSLNLDPVPLAIAWVAAHPAVTAPILGARNVAQLERALEADRIGMTLELYRAIAALSPTPGPATDRSEEIESSSFSPSTTL